MPAAATMLCKRCNNLVTLDSINNEKVAGYNIESLNCPTCSSCISLRIDGVKKTLEEVLENENLTDGWHCVTDGNDLAAHYALSQVIYRRLEQPQQDRNECPFDLPDDCDLIRVLWKGRRAIGFYTLKPKGTYIEHREESYDMVTLDTAYIRSEYRRAGMGLSILEDIRNRHPNEDIAFSSPIAFSMLKVISKFITLYPEMKYKLWEVSGAGSEGSKKLAWFSVAKSKRTSGRSFGRVGPSL